MKVIDSVWVTMYGGQAIGIVVTENEVGVRKIRAGICNSTNEEDDAEYIAKNGGKLFPYDLQRMIDLVKEGAKGE